MPNEKTIPQPEAEIKKEPAAAEVMAGKSADKTVFKKPTVLLTWKAPVREFSPKSRTYFATLLVLALLAFVLLALVKEYTLGLVILAVAFVLFSLNRYEPPESAYELLNTGLKIEGREFRWEQFLSFFIQDKKPLSALYLRTNLWAPRTIKILFSPEHKKQVEKELLKHLDYREFKLSDAASLLDDIVEAFPYNPDAPVPRAVRSTFNKVTKRKKTD